LDLPAKLLEDAKLFKRQAVRSAILGVNDDGTDGGLNQRKGRPETMKSIFGRYLMKCDADNKEVTLCILH
jgi:hypothetical protein